MSGVPYMGFRGPEDPPEPGNPLVPPVGKPPIVPLQDTFCVECGAEDVPLTDGVCRDCRLGDRPLVVVDREAVQVTVCQRCGAEKRGDSWRTRSDATESYDRAALSAVRVHEEVEEPSFTLAFEQTAPQVLQYELTMQGMLWDDPVQDVVMVRVEIQKGICRNCSRKEGGYFEAILQIRPPRDRTDHDHVDDAAAQALDKLAGMREGGRDRAFVTKTVEIHGGYDLYIGDSRAARQVAKELSEDYGAEVGEAHEQIGEEDGQPVMRTSLSVRMPSYAIGDFVDRDGELWRVDGFTRRLVSLTRIPDGRRDHVDAHGDNLRPVRHADDVAEAVVVSRGQGEAQVLDPETMETVTVAVPWGEIGETLPVVRWDGKLRAVPEVGGRS